MKKLFAISLVLMVCISYMPCAVVASSSLDPYTEPPLDDEDLQILSNAIDEFNQHIYKWKEFITKLGNRMTEDMINFEDTGDYSKLREAFLLSRYTSNGGVSAIMDCFCERFNKLNFLDNIRMIKNFCCCDRIHSADKEKLGKDLIWEVDDSLFTPFNSDEPIDIEKYSMYINFYISNSKFMDDPEFDKDNIRPSAYIYNLVEEHENLYDEFQYATDKLEYTLRKLYD